MHPLRPTFPGNGGILKATGEVTRLRLYLDLAVVLNSVVDFLLLMGTNTLAGFPSAWKRNLPAAVLGGLYGGFCLIPGFRFLGNLFWRLVFLGLMGLVAFGVNRAGIKQTGIFVLLSMAMGGIAFCFGQGRFGGLVLSGGLVWLLSRVAFGERVGRQSYVPVTITRGGRRVEVIALRRRTAPARLQCRRRHRGSPHLPRSSRALYRDAQPATQ